MSSQPNSSTKDVIDYISLDSPGRPGRNEVELGNIASNRRVLAAKVTGALGTSDCSISPGGDGEPLIGNSITSVDQARELSVASETIPIELGRDGYALVLVSGRICFLLPMLAVAISQFGILWLIAWSSPEYFFESGQWIVPMSDYWAVNAMKLLALVVTLLRVTGEFKDAAKIFRIVSSSTPLDDSQRFLGSFAFCLQYFVAIVVTFMAIHLILATTSPLQCIGKLWVVYMVLDFDNFLCNFILFVFNLDDEFNWIVKLQRKPLRSGSSMTLSILYLYWVPVCFYLMCVAVSLYLNVCPITGLRYGVVRNVDPVLMLTPNLGSLDGCCPPQVTWDTLSSGVQNLSVRVSVPCVAPSAHSDGEFLPRIYYVVVPDGRLDPSSLQVMEGRAGDGNVMRVHGYVDSIPLQMRWWLTSHGFPAEVYDKMRSEGVGGLELYGSNFPYEGKWMIPDFPWAQRARVFAIAMNVATGALSPRPVQSSVVIRRVCHQHCLQCTHDEICTECGTGFVLLGGRECAPCAVNCKTCLKSGPGFCDIGGCQQGYGLFQKACHPCAGQHCLSCDSPDERTQRKTLDIINKAPSPSGRNSSLSPIQPKKFIFPKRPKQLIAPPDPSPSGRSAILKRPLTLPCLTCEVGYGLMKNATASQQDSCTPCSIPDCSHCGGGLEGHCSQCLPGFVLERDLRGNSSNLLECAPCADHCRKCDLLGRGHCDPEQCLLGFSLSPSGHCDSCSAHCLNCTESGPGKCNVGRCKEGYGLQGSFVCSPCNLPHCSKCDKSKDQCERCKAGYGLTPERACESCTAHCGRCSTAGTCAECDEGFGLTSKGECLACADQCRRCDREGPGLCDEGGCLPGWTTRNSGPRNRRSTCFKARPDSKR